MNVEERSQSKRKSHPSKFIVRGNRSQKLLQLPTLLLNFPFHKLPLDLRPLRRIPQSHRFQFVHGRFDIKFVFPFELRQNVFTKDEIGTMMHEDMLCDRRGGRVVAGGDGDVADVFEDVPEVVGDGDPA